MPNIHKQNMRYDNSENWVMHCTFFTFGTKGYGRIPINLVSRFVTFEMYDNVADDETVILSAFTDTSSSALANAVSGIAVLDVPLSSTSGITPGVYEYAVYILDFPYRTSATYAKKAMEGAVEVT